MINALARTSLLSFQGVTIVCYRPNILRKTASTLNADQPAVYTGSEQPQCVGFGEYFDQVAKRFVVARLCSDAEIARVSLVHWVAIVLYLFGQIFQIWPFTEVSDFTFSIEFGSFAIGIGTH